MKTRARSSGPRLRRLRRLVPRGQALLEYTMVSHALLIGTGVALLPVMVKLFQYWNQYLDSFYFVLQTGAL